MGGHAGDSSHVALMSAQQEGEPPWYGEEGPDPLRLPRVQEGARPQHLITTLFADFWFGRREPLPSAALVALVAEFGISPTSARAALSRLGRRGLLSSAKVGRHTFYGPTEQTAAEMVRYQSRILSFGLRESRPWDGSWLIVGFSVPDEARDRRRSLHKRLRWLGFAPLQDGLWVSARPVADEARSAVTECGVPQATVFSSTVLFSTADDEPARAPLVAWDLDRLRRFYDEFVARFEPVCDRMDQGTIGTSEALVERTAVMDAWSDFPGIDPELPASTLPADWPREHAQRIFSRVYDDLGPPAEVRFRQILAEHDPALAGLTRHYTTATAATAAPVPGPDRR